jgi:hypothetical protein
MKKLDSFEKSTWRDQNKPTLLTFYSQRANASGNLPKL